MIDTVKTIKVGELGSFHEVGNRDCEVGWCGCLGWPAECECGGVIHVEFGDEDSDCNYFLYHKCDKCGSTNEP